VHLHVQMHSRRIDQGRNRMSGVQSSEDGTEALPHVRELAELLAYTRKRAGLTVRQLGGAIGYSHPHVARATSGTSLPSLTLMTAYLAGCGLDDGDQQAWLRLWALAKKRTRQQTLVRDPTNDREWKAATAAVGEVVPLFMSIRRASGRDEFLASLRRLSARTGLSFPLGVAARCGLPSKTIEAWNTGEVTPTADQLDHVVRSLGGSSRERREFIECLHRIARAAPCDGIHPSTHRPCVRSSAHQGRHLAKGGISWLDD
jgi:transcriptional regulator with XRE-family HTH domain